ncbi:MAG: cytosolic protein [Deltaproteobacteria bacterium]|nr:cytosolic protein [Candidatus Tharpella aukensis]
MDDMSKIIDDADDALLVKMIIDSFRRTMVHYGQWLAQVEHQLGMEKAMAVEAKVWTSSFGNQLNRLAKIFGFEVKEGAPAYLQSLSREEKLNLLKNLGVNWLANDGIWFQAVENKYGMNDAKRCNDSCWTRYSPFEAERIKELLELPENGGIPALKKALAYRMYALINKQSIEDVNENCIIFRMNECRVQLARKRKGMEDYPCKSVGLVEYPYFARTIDSRIETECIGCPPDKHPKDWFCAWKFTVVE